jgi:hypothetical protein
VAVWVGLGGVRVGEEESLAMNMNLTFEISKSVILENRVLLPLLRYFTW